MTADRACRDSLGDVAGVLDAAVRDDARAHAARLPRAQSADRRHLRHAHARIPRASCEMEPGPMPTLIAVRARLEQIARVAAGRRHVARDQPDRFGNVARPLRGLCGARRRPWNGRARCRSQMMSTLRGDQRRHALHARRGSRPQPAPQSRRPHASLAELGYLTAPSQCP